MSIKLIRKRNNVNIQNSTNNSNPQEVPKNFRQEKLKDGRGGTPTSIWYNPDNGDVNVEYDKSTGHYSISGNTNGIIIKGTESRSKLVIKDGEKVQFTSGGGNSIFFDNCTNTKAYGGKGNDYFAYMGGKNNTNYNMNFKKHTVKNTEIKFRLFSPTTWFGGYSQNLKSYYLKDGENKTDNTDNNNKSNNG